MNAIVQLLILLAVEIAGLVALWFLLRARIRRYLDLENLLSGVREEARALVIELNETADRNVSLVEDKIAALRDVLDEVDRRMGVARRELDTREAEREVFARLSRRRPILPEEDREHPRPFPSAGPSRAEPREAPSEGPSQAPPIPLPLGARAAAEPARAESGLELPVIALSSQRIKTGPTPREEALRLYRQGFSVDVVAAKAGMTVAEVELLVELEERRSGG